MAKFELKYITFRDHMALERIVMFGHTTHDKIALSLDLSTEKIIGAGFVDLKQLICHGESNSLKIKTHEIDTRTLRFNAGLDRNGEET